MALKPLEERLSGIPNTTILGQRETVTLWYNSLSGTIYGTGCSNPGTPDVKNPGVVLVYWDESGPLPEVVDFTNYTRTKGLEKALEQIKEYRAKIKD